MATAIFRSPMSFFDTTPAGRILNRFSSDIYKVDEVLARTFNMLFVNVAKSGFTLAVVSFGTPAFIGLIIPLGALYVYVQRYYLRSSRELKRLDSVSRSPIYAHFQETLGGISTIRAYRQQQRFLLENEWRVDSNLKAFFPSISANRWLAIRLEFIGAVVILAAAGFSIVSVTSHSGLTAGMVGLSMSYALQITSSLNWIVRQTVEVETNIVSVERVLEYARLPSEAPEINPRNRPPASWPANGTISFNNYSARYREGLDLVLKNIKLDVKSHEKIGVVGRTGAGKSSLTLALFRLIEPATGNITIDNINTSSIGLLDLRRRLAIIPQDAALFEGTVRDNLDPGHVHDVSCHGPCRLVYVVPLSRCGCMLYPRSILSAPRQRDEPKALTVPRLILLFSIVSSPRTMNADLDAAGYRIVERSRGKLPHQEASLSNDPAIWRVSVDVVSPRSI